MVIWLLTATAWVDDFVIDEVLSHWRWPWTWSSFFVEFGSFWNLRCTSCRWEGWWWWGWLSKNWFDAMNDWINCTCCWSLCILDWSWFGQIFACCVSINLLDDLYAIKSTLSNQLWRVRGRLIASRVPYSRPSCCEGHVTRMMMMRVVGYYHMSIVEARAHPWMYRKSEDNSFAHNIQLNIQ